jgi:hypothetical protein
MDFDTRVELLGAVRRWRPGKGSMAAWRWAGLTTSRR